MTKICLKKICYIIAIISTIYSFGANAEIENKGLVCKCFEDKDTRFSCSPDSPIEGLSSYLGIFFKDGIVEVHFLDLQFKKNKYVPVINIEKNDEYLLEPTFVQWPKKYDLGQDAKGYVRFDKGNTFLDRKTLILTNIHEWGHPGNKYRDYRKYDCSSHFQGQYKNPIVGYDNFKNVMDTFREDSEIARNELQKGNKL